MVKPVSTGVVQQLGAGSLEFQNLKKAPEVPWPLQNGGFELVPGELALKGDAKKRGGNDTVVHKYNDNGNDVTVSLNDVTDKASVTVKRGDTLLYRGTFHHELKGGGLGDWVLTKETKATSLTKDVVKNVSTGDKTQLKVGGRTIALGSRIDAPSDIDGLSNQAAIVSITRDVQDGDKERVDLIGNGANNRNAQVGAYVSNLNASEELTKTPRQYMAVSAVEQKRLENLDMRPQRRQSSLVGFTTPEVKEMRKAAIKLAEAWDNQSGPPSKKTILDILKNVDHSDMEFAHTFDLNEMPNERANELQPPYVRFEYKGEDSRIELSQSLRERVKRDFSSDPDFRKEIELWVMGSA